MESTARAQASTGGTRPSAAPFPIRIVIADDHPIFRSSLRTLLESEPDFTVVGEGHTAAEAVAIVMERKPDLLLLEPAICGASGMLDRLRSLPTSRIILLTAAIETADMLQALRVGVRGIILKHTATELLFKCIRVVMDGEYWIGRDTVSALVQLLAQAPVAHAEKRPAQSFGLSQREREIVQAIVAGHANRDIARKFAICEDTVKHHLTSIFNKTGASTRLELALFALHHRLVDQA